MGPFRRGDSPLHQRLAETLRRQIARGAFRPGEALPSEPALCRRFRVSRGTVRQALAELERERLLYRMQGRGTFVGSPEADRHLGRYFRWARRGTRLPIDPRLVVLGMGPEVPPREVARALRLRPATRALRLERLAHAGGEPICLYTSYLPWGLTRGLARADLASARLYHLMEAHCGLLVLRAEEFLAPGLATTRQAELLHIKPGDPVLVIQRLAYTFADQPIEFRVTVGRGEDYWYYLVL